MFLPQTYNLRLIERERADKAQLRDVLQNGRPGLLTWSRSAKTGNIREAVRATGSLRDTQAPPRGTPRDRTGPSREHCGSLNPCLCTDRSTAARDWWEAVLTVLMEKDTGVYRNSLYSACNFSVNPKPSENVVYFNPFSSLACLLDQPRCLSPSLASSLTY